MILSELIPFLKKIDAKPKKSLSQNFLIDPNIVRKIVHTADISPGDIVLEIGPGPGALTSVLLDAGAKVFAIEKDTLFAKELSRFQTPDRRLKVFEADVLDFDLKTLPLPLKVVANLPYHITTPILEKIFSHPFISLTLMVQKEVAVRMAAKEGSKDYGCLSLFVQFYTTPNGLFKVPPSCFYPQPKVDSSVIRLDSRNLPPISPDLFFPLVRKAFQQRRKMISSSLQPLYSADQIREGLLSSGISKTARPEELSFSQWVELSKTMSTNYSKQAT